MGVVRFLKYLWVATGLGILLVVGCSSHPSSLPAPDRIPQSVVQNGGGSGAGPSATPSSDPTVTAPGGGGCTVSDPNGPLTNCAPNCSGFASGGVPTMTCYFGFGDGLPYTAGDYGPGGGGSNPVAVWGGAQDPHTGCWDFSNGEACNGTSQVAIAPGSPQPGQSCQLTDSAKSLGIGTTVGEVNVNGQTQARSVADVTALYSYGGAVPLAPNFLYINLKPVGFIYQDDNGGFWFQKDPQANWSLSFGAGVNLGSIFSANFGISPPSDEIPHALGPHPGKIGNHMIAAKCWKNDTPVFPGELS